MTDARVMVTGDDVHPVVVITGEIDLANVESVGRQVNEALTNQVVDVVLDLTGLVYLDSTGLQFLFTQRLRQIRQHH